MEQMPQDLFQAAVEQILGGEDVPALVDFCMRALSAPVGACQVTALLSVGRAFTHNLSLLHASSKSSTISPIYSILMITPSTDLDLGVLA
jgi:hypothetical protein